ncbi:U1 zinc finger-domain-containing protein [Russula compacta]|nr:U1 zinc finger-domain-containing protein [Russula compacta]
MPKHYCDYCDVYLTHDSASVRKAHNSGRNHLANVRDYYASLGHDKAQSIIDQITSAYESGGGPPPGGFGFGPQHLTPSGPGFGPPPGYGGLPPGFGRSMFLAPDRALNASIPPGCPPIPPNGAPPGGSPFPPPNFSGSGGPPPPHLGGPPPSSGNPGSPGNGPTPPGPGGMHPDRLRMMGGR